MLLLDPKVMSLSAAKYISIISWDTALVSCREGEGQSCRMSPLHQLYNVWSKCEVILLSVLTIIQPALSMIHDWQYNLDNENYQTISNWLWNDSGIL